jgi:hypothetical protein
MLVPVAIAALGASLYFPSFEYVMGGKDPGVYVNAGVQIAKRGALDIDDELMASIPAELTSLFFRPATEREPYPMRFMGFFLNDPGDGRVFAQFPHWFPASIAIGYDAAGLTGARGVAGIWAVIGIVAVYFAGTRLFGVVAAAMAATLLAIHVLQVWFGRYPNAEVASQALVFGSLAAFRHALDGSPRFFGALAALFAGLQLFGRFDGLLSVGALAGAAILAAAWRERAGRTFGVILAASTAVGVWYLVGPMWHYSANYVGTMRYGGGVWMLAALAVAALAFVRLMRIARLRALTVAWLPRALALGIVALALYGGFVREPAPLVPVQNAHALRHFGWYLTTPGLVAAVAGFAWLVWRHFWRHPALFLTIAIYGVLTFYKPRIVPEHFWAGRRYLAVILPGAMLSLAAVATSMFDPARLARWRIPRVASTALAVAALVPLGLSFWSAAAPVRAHVEYAGLQQAIERRLVANVGPRDLVLVESRRADSDLHVLGLPLAYLYDRPVLVIDAWDPDKRQLEAFVAWARGRFDNIYFLGGGGTDLLSRGLDAELVAASRFGVPEYASTFNAYPREVRQKEFDIGLYRLRPADPRPGGPVDLQLGAQDDLNVARFFAKEQRADGSTFRWTKNRSYVMLRGVGAEARELTIWMSSGGRPAQAPPADVEIRAGGALVGRATPADEVRAYRFPLPPGVVRAAAATGDPLRVQIDVPTWSPRAILNLPDTRDLGVLVTRVQVE